MKDQKDIQEARNLARIMHERLDEDEHHIEAIGVGIIEQSLGWVLGEDENDTLLEDLREDVEETENGEIEL